MIPFIAWSILVLFLMAGLVGILIPAMPGIILILLGVTLFKILLPIYLSWWTVGTVLLGVGLTFGLDMFGSFVGAKWGGASKYGMAGLFLGGLLGLFFAPAGLILGPLLGVFVGEVFLGRRTVGEGTKAGIGATAGVAFATIFKFLLGLVLVGWVVCDLFFFS